MHYASNKSLVIPFSWIVLDIAILTVSCLGGAICLGRKGVLSWVFLCYDLLTEMHLVEIDCLWLVICLGSEILW